MAGQQLARNQGCNLSIMPLVPLDQPSFGHWQTPPLKNKPSQVAKPRPPLFQPLPLALFLMLLINGRLKWLPPLQPAPLLDRVQSHQHEFSGLTQNASQLQEFFVLARG